MSEKVEEDRKTKDKCGVCHGTGKVIIGWIMPYANAKPVYPDDKCPVCEAK